MLPAPARLSRMTSGDTIVSPLHTIRDPLVSAEPSGPVFEHLLRSQERDLRSFLSALVRQASVCEDLYQETARELWRHFDRYDGARPFGAWSRGVARHVVQRHFRKTAREGRVFSPQSIDAIASAWDAAAEAEAPAASDEVIQALAICVAALPEDARAAVEDFYTRRTPVAAIAGSLGRSVDAVYQLLTRSRARFAACLRRRLAGAED